MPIRVVPPRSALVPAAARSETLTVEEADLNSEAVETFAKAVGGRDNLVEVLSVADTAPEVGRIVNLLLDPRYADWSLRKLCTQSGITVAQLFTAYKKALITRAHIEATQVIAQKLVPIVDDVMNRALSDPTVERQKLALELGHLIEKKSGFVVNATATASAGAAALQSHGPGALEQLQQAVGDLLFAPRDRTARPVVEAEATPADPEPEPEPAES